jgi:molybdate transport system regulatory protein
MKIRTKIWIESDDGRPLLGDGRLEILEAVARAGSLSGAARELGMSYRSLWGKVRTIEARLGVPLVRGNAGGPQHGGATLTDEAIELVRAFAAFRARVDAAIGGLADEALPGFLRKS